MKYCFVLVTVFLISLVPAFCSADTLTVSIISFDDDAEEDITGPLAGDVRRTSSDLEIGNENEVLQWVGLRFQNIAIPPGAVINSASIRFTANETDVGVLVLPIFGEDSSNPNVFSDLTPLTGRPLTDAFTNWNIDPWFPGDSGVNTTTPDLAPIVQEIVDRGDWAEGNPLVFLIQNDPSDTSERIAVSFDGNPLQAAELTIDFTNLLGDANGDGVFNNFDIASFVLALTNPVAYLALFPEVDPDLVLDMNGDGVFDNLDIAGFVAALTG